MTHTPFWNPEHFKAAALAEWNLAQPAWKAVKKYEDLTPAEQSFVDDRAEVLEWKHMLEATAESIRKTEC